jgi:RHS repeat-associated protein
LQRSLASGLRERFRYGDGGRLLDYVLDRGGRDGDVLLDYRVTYDVLGRPAQLEQDGRPVRLTCDRCGRLLRVEETLHGRDQEQERFTYDPASNPLDARVAPAPSIGRANRLMNWGDRELSYDDRGRLAADRLGRDLRTFSYDSADQLVSVQLPGGQTVRYEYDPLRRRVAKQVGEARTLFGWDRNRLSWELGPDGTRRCYFYPGPDEFCPVMFADCQRLPDGELQVKAYHVHYDLARRPVRITDATGRVVWSAQVAAYGQTSVAPDSTLVYNLRAPGQYSDTETGLHYNYHRYYDPQTGRYIQPDPIGLAGGLNLYGYGSGNPFLACDLDGLVHR